MKSINSKIMIKLIEILSNLYLKWIYYSIYLIYDIYYFYFQKINVNIINFLLETK